MKAARVTAMALLCACPIGVGISFGVGADRWQGPLLWVIVLAVSLWLVAGTIYMGGA